MILGKQSWRLILSQYSVFSIQYSVFSIQYSVFSIQYSVFSIQYSVFSIQYSVFSVYKGSPAFNQCAILNSANHVLFTLYSLLFTLYSLLFTLYSLLLTPYSLLLTPYSLHLTLLLLTLALKRVHLRMNNILILKDALQGEGSMKRGMIFPLLLIFITGCLPPKLNPGSRTKKRSPPLWPPPGLQQSGLRTRAPRRKGQLRPKPMLFPQPNPLRQKRPLLPRPQLQPRPSPLHCMPRIRSSLWVFPP